MSTSTSAESPSKRRKAEPANPLKDLSADQFASKVSLFSGPMVIINAGGHDFTLPKGLLCYQSTFFEKAFNGNFKEANEQKLTLTGCSSETFQFVIQWMFTSQVVLPTPSDPLAGPSEKVIAGDISRLLDFLKIADEINLLGPFNQVVESMRSKLQSCPTSLHFSHIRTAFDIQSAHDARNLFVQACVKDYLMDMHALPYTNYSNFRFQKQMDECDGFAAALLKEIRAAYLTRVVTTRQRQNIPTVTFTDPLLGGKFNVTL